MGARRRGATNRSAGKRKTMDNASSPQWTGCTRKKQRVPRAWPWCDETKSMARERRATWGRLGERAGERGCEGSTALARGAVTLVAQRRGGPHDGTTKLTTYDTPAQGVTLERRIR